MTDALPLTHIVQRRTLAIASSRLTEEPVVALQGARAVGSPPSSNSWPQLWELGSWTLTISLSVRLPRPIPAPSWQALLSAPVSAVTSSFSATTRADYVARISAGGFPLALARASEASRYRWFDDYIKLVLERYVRELAKIRQREQLPGLLRRLAGQTAQVLNLTSAAAASGMDRTTASEYVRLLEAVFMVFRLEAWGKTLRARVAGTPKLHVVDSGVAARLLRLTPEKLGRLDAASLAEFGHLLETFVVGELLKQLSWLDGIAGCGHWRTHDGDEVDLVVKRDDGGVVAFEVKVAARVPGRDMRSLRKLREAVGDAFIAGVAFYTGGRSYSFDDRLFVLPVDRIWNPI